jgi:hypothetical protein
VLLGAFVGFAVLAMIANAVFHSRLERLLDRQRHEARAPDPQPSMSAIVAKPTDISLPEESASVEPQVQATAPLPVNQPLSTSRQRVFVGLTPQDLIKPFGTYISAQAEKLTRAYIGKWLTVTGRIGDVHRHTRVWQVTMSFEDDVHRVLVVSLSFGNEWGDRLSVLTRDATITANGQIENVTSSMICLRNCELVA